MSDFTTGFFTHRYDEAEAVELAIDGARIGRAHYPGVGLRESLEALLRVVAERSWPPLTDAQEPTHQHGVVAAPARPDQELTQESFWSAIQSWLPTSTTVVAEAGTAFYGALELHLPDQSDLLGQPVWSSIGYTIPATLGAALARPDRRPVLFVGDGSAQLTAQELGTIYDRGLRPAVFLINNGGYTVERVIQSPTAAYQDIVAWNWTLLPAALGATDIVVRTVRTTAELDAVLNEMAGAPSAGFFVEVLLPPLDGPRLLMELVKGIAETNARQG